MNCTPLGFHWEPLVNRITKIQPEQQPKSSSSNKFLQSTKITNFCNKHRERYQLEIGEIAGRHIHFLAQLEVEDFQG